MKYSLFIILFAFIHISSSVAQNNTGIPSVEINTENLTSIVSKTDYVEAIIKISNCIPYEEVEMSCKIRGRGNATWKDYPKKPYKIKLEKKLSLFGFPANKDWVLLAEYCDKSLLRTSFMCEVSKAVGINYTVNYQHVEVTLNGEYLGVYVLTDQVEKGENRVPVEEEGYLIEDDNYYNKEPLFFTSTLGYNYTFKYPNADKGNINKGDEKYVFINNFIANMEDALLSIPVDNENYKLFIDIKSFAKWYVVAEVTGNWEPNLFYAIYSQGCKLKMLPMWDAEWSLGLASKGNDKDPNGWFIHPHESRYDIHIWKDRKYFQYLFKDPSFVAEVKEVWNEFKQHIDEVKYIISMKQEEIQYAQQDNFIKWPILGEYIAVSLVSFQTWQEEVEYILSFFDKRVKWLDEELEMSSNLLPPTLKKCNNETIYSLRGHKIMDMNSSLYPIIIKNKKVYINRRKN